MKQDKELAQKQKRYGQLTQRLAKVGHVLQGTITERTIRREFPKGSGKHKDYGPYYQWTWKHKGKTVTVNLSASQAKAYRRAINQHRKMESILEQLRALSREILDMKTESVKRRRTHNSI